LRKSSLIWVLLVLLTVTIFRNAVTVFRNAEAAFLEQLHFFAKFLNLGVYAMTENATVIRVKAFRRFQEFLSKGFNS
jgi:hypothetical protein